MSKSYRRPYAPVTGVQSAAHDKMIARRAHRRMQNQTLRDFIASDSDWDGFLNPERLEASSNEVYGWARDGKQVYQGYRWNNLDNLFYCSWRMSSYTVEELLKHYEERIQRYEEWQRLLRRK